MNALKGTLVAAPIVSSDNMSPEAVLAREAKRVQAQAEADTKYDDKNIQAEAFIDPSSYVDHRSRNLALGALASAGFLAVVVFAARK